MTSKPVWLKVPHDIVGIKPHQRTALRCRLTQEHPFAIREIDQDGTVLVAELQRQNPSTVRGLDQHFTWREYEGRLYRSLVAADGGPVRIGADSRPVYGELHMEAACIKERVDYPFGGGTERSQVRGLNGIFSLLDRPAGTIAGYREPLQQDGLQRALVQAQARSESLVLIDGQLYIEAPPPTWSLFSSDLGRERIEDAHCGAFIPDYDDWAGTVWTSPDRGRLSDLLTLLSRDNGAEITIRNRDELLFYTQPPQLDPRPILGAALVFEAERYLSGLTFTQIDAEAGAAFGMMRMVASRAPRGWSAEDAEQFQAATTMLAALPELGSRGMFDHTPVDYLGRRQALSMIASRYQAIVDLAAGLEPEVDDSLADIPAL